MDVGSDGLSKIFCILFGTPFLKFTFILIKENIESLTEQLGSFSRFNTVNFSILTAYRHSWQR